MHTNVCVCQCICVYIYVCVLKYVYVYVCIYIYIYTFRGQTMTWALLDPCHYYAPIYEVVQCNISPVHYPRQQYICNGNKQTNLLKQNDEQKRLESVCTPDGVYTATLCNMLCNLR